MRIHAYRLALAGGVALLAYGVSMWSVPAALVIGGLAVAAAGLAGMMGLVAAGGDE